MMIKQEKDIKKFSLYSTPLSLFSCYTRLIYSLLGLMQFDECGIGGRFCAVFIIRHNCDDFGQRYPCIIESEIVLFRAPFWPQSANSLAALFHVALSGSD